MTNSVITIVHSIEDEYGMNSNDWTEDDLRLKKLHEWYITHPDEKRRKLSDRNIQEIQKALDEQMQKKDICKIFEISPTALARDIKLGIFSDVKWKMGREVKNEL